MVGGLDASSAGCSGDLLKAAHFARSDASLRYAKPSWIDGAESLRPGHGRLPADTDDQRRTLRLGLTGGALASST
jgi:hypothetical protein